MKLIRFLAMAALVLSSGMALAADAAPPPPGGGARGACKADVEKLCSGVQRGGGRIAACLKQNDAQVSAPCKDAMAQRHARKAPAPTAAPQG